MDNNEKKRTATNGIKSFFSHGLLTKVMAIIIIGLLIYIFFLSNSHKDTAASLSGTIVEISELATIEYDYTYVDDYSNSRKAWAIDIPLTQKYFVCSIPGTIKYGVNLGSITDNDIKVNDGAHKITINMPEIIELSNDPNTKKIHYYAEDNNLLNPISVEDAKKFQLQAEEEAEKEAIKRGIIKRTQTHTEEVVRAVIHSMPQYREYDVECNFPKQTEVKMKESK